MKKVLCLLTIATLIVQMLARPDAATTPAAGAATTAAKAATTAATKPDVNPLSDMGKKKQGMGKVFSDVETGVEDSFGMIFG